MPRVKVVQKKLKAKVVTKKKSKAVGRKLEDIGALLVRKVDAALTAMVKKCLNSIDMCRIAAVKEAEKLRSDVVQHIWSETDRACRDGVVAARGKANEAVKECQQIVNRTWDDRQRLLDEVTSFLNKNAEVTIELNKRLEVDFNNRVKRLEGHTVETLTDMIGEEISRYKFAEMIRNECHQAIREATREAIFGGGNGSV